MAKFNYRGYVNKYSSLIDIGFLPEEAKELATRSRNALVAPPYMRRFIRSRRRLRRNAENNGWTDTQYENYIRSQYAKNNAIYQGHATIPDGTLNVWAMVREYERRSKDKGEQYESPWRRDIEPKKKKDHQTVTRRDMLASMIESKRRTVQRIGNPNKREKAEEELFALEQRLRKMDAEKGGNEP